MKCVGEKAAIQRKTPLNRGLKERKNACIWEKAVLCRGNSQYIGFEEKVHQACLRTPMLIWLELSEQERSVRDEAREVMEGGTWRLE